MKSLQQCVAIAILKCDRNQTVGVSKRASNSSLANGVTNVSESRGAIFKFIIRYLCLQPHWEETEWATQLGRSRF